MSSTRPSARASAGFAQPAALAPWAGLLLLALLTAVSAARAESNCAFRPADYERRLAGSERFEPIGDRLSLPSQVRPSRSLVRFRLPPTAADCWLVVDRVAVLGLNVAVEGLAPQEFGFFRPTANDRLAAAGFVVAVPAHAQEREVLLAIDHLGAISSRIERLDLPGLLQLERRMGMVRAMSVVAPGLIVLMVGIFWLRLRDPALAAYLGFVLSTIATAVSLDGTIYFVPGLRELARLHTMGPILALALLGLSLIAFFRIFLAPLDASGRRTLNGLTALFGFVAVGSLVWLPWFSVAVMNLVAFSLLIAFPLMFWQAWRSWRGGHPLAIYLLIGWSLPLLVVPLRVLSEFGLVEWGLTLRYAPRFTFLIESMVFALGLADRLLRIRLERDRAERKAKADALTGLSSRHALNDELGRWESEDIAGSVLFFDIDHFKKFNDRYGHAQGDQVLRAVAEALRSDLPAFVHTARYGGEELVALLPGIDREEAMNLAESARRRIAETVRGPEDSQVTVSVGIAQRQDKAAMSDALTRADAALYRAKSGGRNRVEAD